MIPQRRRNENVSQISQSQKILATDVISKNRAIKIVLHDAVYRLIRDTLPSKCHMVSRYTHKSNIIDTDILMILGKNKDKYIEKNFASRWSFTKNHYMMHG